MAWSAYSWAEVALNTSNCSMHSFRSVPAGGRLPASDTMRDPAIAPSDEPQYVQKLIGRYNLRRIAGQDPDKFTPVRNMHHPAYGGDEYDGPLNLGPP